MAKKSENGHTHVHIWVDFYLKNQTTKRAYFSIKRFEIALFDIPKSKKMSIPSYILYIIYYIYITLFHTILVIRFDVFELVKCRLEKCDF